MTGPSLRSSTCIRRTEDAGLHRDSERSQRLVGQASLDDGQTTFLGSKPLAPGTYYVRVRAQEIGFSATELVRDSRPGDRAAATSISAAISRSAALDQLVLIGSHAKPRPPGGHCRDQLEGNGRVPVRMVSSRADMCCPEEQESSLRQAQRFLLSSDGRADERDQGQVHWFRQSRRRDRGEDCRASCRPVIASAQATARERVLGADRAHIADRDGVSGWDASNAPIVARPFSAIR